MVRESSSVRLTRFVKRLSSRHNSFPGWRGNSSIQASNPVANLKYSTDINENIIPIGNKNEIKGKSYIVRADQHDGPMNPDDPVSPDRVDLTLPGIVPDRPNVPKTRIPEKRQKCCWLCPPRWVFSALIVVLYLVFFGCSISYSWIYVFGDPLCDIQTTLCNMQLSGCVVIMASLCVFGANLVFHLINFRSPNIQRQYIRIQFLVPVLCAQSWVFMFASREVIIAYSVFAEAYKTFSLYSVLHLFLNFLWENCNGHRVIPERMPIAQVVGFQFCVRPIKTVREFYITTIIGAMQAIIFRPFAFALIAILHMYYSDSSVLFYAAKGVNVLQWASQCYAIYAVLLWARNFRDDYSCLWPLVKHFGLMLFHILLPTLMPQVTDILINYEALNLEEFFNGNEDQHLGYKVQGFFQACFGFLGTFYLTWMYSSRDVRHFSNEDTPRRPVTTALSHLLSPKDFIQDFELMGCPCRCSSSVIDTDNIHANPNDLSPTFADEVIYQTNESNISPFADHASTHNSWLGNRRYLDGEETDTSRIETASKGCVSKAGSSASIDEPKSDEANFTNINETRYGDGENGAVLSSSARKGSCEKRAAVYHLT